MSLRKKKNKEEPGELDTAKEELAALIRLEADERAAELQRILALARAESVAALSTEERRLADARRIEFAERERRVTSELARRLGEAETGMEQRFAAWAQDLERMQEGFTERILRLEARQQQLVDEVEARIAADAERLQADSDDQQAMITRLRADLEQAARTAVEAAHNELETHATERRRALHEVAERLRRRERELSEQVEREQTEAARRLQEAFADVERRQVEQLERSVRREAGRFAEAAALQFDATIKEAREESARRLARELDRAVTTFLREADKILAERMHQLGESGGQRLEQRLRQMTANLERQRDELVESLERRQAEIEMGVGRQPAPRKP